ncbi:MAG: hypothetical protein HN348_01950 [Proteobacteria bacterium]|nr:hypothetical protein [Pseudomonadota bacterium]
MMNSRLTFFGLLSLALLTPVLSTPAFSAPLELHHQGRIMDATGVPYSGVHQLAVGLYDSDSGGQPLWDEDLDINFDNGYFAVTLGADQTNPLDDDVFASDLWVELAINGVLFPDRQPVASVPFAIYARSADTATNVVGGIVDVAEIRVDGNTVIDGDGNFLGTDTLLALECDSGDIPVYDGSDWLCAEYVDDDTLADLGGVCVDGQFPTWDDTLGEWGCEHPLDDQDILGIVTDTPIDLALGSSIGGADLSTLTMTDVEQHFAGNAMELGTGSNVAGDAIATVTTSDTDYVNAAGGDAMVGDYSVDGNFNVTNGLMNYEGSEVATQSWVGTNYVDLTGDSTVAGVFNATTLQQDGVNTDALYVNATGGDAMTGDYSIDGSLNVTNGLLKQEGDEVATQTWSNTSFVNLTGDSNVAGTLTATTLAQGGENIDTTYVNATGGDSLTGDYTVTGKVDATTLAQGGEDIDTTYVNAAGDTITGSVSIETTGSNAIFSVQSEDDDFAWIGAYGLGSQGTGIFYVGQSTQYGGGLIYNGDDDPDLVGETDRITFFRRNNFNDYPVFDYMYNSDKVIFHGDIDVTGSLLVGGANIDSTYANASGGDTFTGDYVVDGNLNLTTGELSYGGDEVATQSWANNNLVETTGDSTIAGTLNATTLQQGGVDLDTTYVNASGGDTMTGDYIVDGNFNLTTGKMNYKDEEVATMSWAGDNFVDLSGDTMTGDLAVDVSGGDAALHVKADDGHVAEVAAMGSGGQGTGILYVGQSHSWGGGIIYNGDNNPNVVGASDRISFFRRNGYDEVGEEDHAVFDYSYANDNVNFYGNINVVPTAGNGNVVVKTAEDSIASLEAYGTGGTNGQGTGRLYVGQSEYYGGGIIYNGDDNPNTTGTADTITFFRRENGVDHEVFDYSYANNDVDFYGDVVATGNIFSNSWEQITAVGDTSASASCTAGKTVVFGWTLQLNDEAPGIEQARTGFGNCTPGLGSCSVSSSNYAGNDEIRIWMVCG